MNAAEMRRRMQAGEVMLGLGVRLARSTEIVSLAKAAGYHWLFIDMEHSGLGSELVCAIAVAALDAGLVPIARVPGCDPLTASRLSDGGVAGIVVPHVDTPGQIAPVVERCKFAPIGRRSNAGPLPQTGYRALTMPEHMRAVNEQTLVCAMIESPEGVANAAAIAAVPGVDMLLFGTSDLTIELGIPGEIGHPDVEAAFRSVFAATAPHGTVLGLGGANTRDLLARYLPLGFRFVLLGSDTPLLLAGMRGNVAMAHEALGRS